MIEFAIEKFGHFDILINNAGLMDNFAPVENLDTALCIEVPSSFILERMTGRRVCPACGASYHIKFNPTKVDNVCDACGGQLILRDDDQPETVKKRLDVYHAQTQPLIDYYTAKNVLKSVDGTVDMNEVFQAIVNILGE